ncbi:MAG TPA: hypothetical protein VK588_15815, partial [Chitinophagaceae bacterium]|nr:hypothetical protein [Chitinophagaceae bacterium]
MLNTVQTPTQVENLNNILAKASVPIGWMLPLFGAIGSCKFAAQQILDSFAKNPYAPDLVMGSISQKQTTDLY